MVEPDPLLLKCEELLEILHGYPQYLKLHALTKDIEGLRDRLLAEGRERGAD
jgi:hypothetical protein